jgi:hypothetical protein
MGNVVWLERLLLGALPEAPRTVVELGSGDGTFMLELARRLAPCWGSPVQIQLLDRQPVIAPETIDEFNALGWSAEIIPADLHDWIEQDRGGCDLILANLFLHHFTDEQLRISFAGLAGRSRAFASCDPRRWFPAVFSCRLLWLIGCNEVTRHDALASVRAGFRERELSRLWPADSSFDLIEKPGGYASHLFMARRHGWKLRGFR